MKPPPFEYHAPRSLAEACELLSAHGEEAAVLAGGQSLVPLLNRRALRPRALVDINGVSELAHLRADRGLLRVGALARHREVATAPAVARHAPLLARAAGLVGHPAIRNRGTIGGSLAHALPAGELPCAAVALDARIKIVGPGGDREIVAGDFFTGPGTTVLGASELIVEVHFPAQSVDAGWAFAELAPRRRDFPVVSVGVLLSCDGGTVAGARVAVNAAAGRPARAHLAEEAVAGASAEAATYRRASALAAEALELDASSRDEARYQRQVARGLVERLLARAHARCGAVAAGTQS